MKTSEYDEHEADDRQNDLEEAMEHDRQALVRAARNLSTYGWQGLSSSELRVLDRLLQVFDPPPPVQEEEDIKF